MELEKLMLLFTLDVLLFKHKRATNSKFIFFHSKIKAEIKYANAKWALMSRNESLLQSVIIN